METKRIILLGIGISLLIASVALFVILYIHCPIMTVYDYTIILDSRTNYRIYVLVDGKTVIADENQGFVFYGFDCKTSKIVINAYSDSPFNITIREDSPNLHVLKNETLIFESHTYFIVGSLNPYY